MKRINFKSQKGFTMTDLAVSLIMFSIFTGIIGTLMYNSFKINLETEVAGRATMYAIEILEDIDKITYDEVTNGMESMYINKFAIPSSYNINIEVSNYNEETEKQDLIKKVKLTINYTFSEKTDKLVIYKLKVKEIK